MFSILNFKYSCCSSQLSMRFVEVFAWFQCHQIGVIYGTLGNVSKPVATIILPELPTFQAMCQNLSIFQWNNFCATFIDIWRLFTSHTVWFFQLFLLHIDEIISTMCGKEPTGGLLGSTSVCCGQESKVIFFLCNKRSSLVNNQSDY